VAESVKRELLPDLPVFGFELLEFDELLKEFYGLGLLEYHLESYELDQLGGRLKSVATVNLWRLSPLGQQQFDRLRHVFSAEGGGPF
jgi:hypothetical protein